MIKYLTYAARVCDPAVNQKYELLYQNIGFHSAPGMEWSRILSRVVTKIEEELWPPSPLISGESAC